MRVPTNKLPTVFSSSLLFSLLALAGCDKPAVPKTDVTANAPAVQAASYVPPTADQLSQMVAPIALFPDKLVGQVLAGATYPLQITAATQWLAQNPSLKGDALQSAERTQPWDVSVKSLTTFPSVLDQMASNIQWTTSLGEAYANDPTDVMNAIQVLRLRAQQSGNLKSSQHLRVSSSARAYEPAPQDYVASSPSESRIYDGPPVVSPPPQTIIIESAQPDVVYVPQYNPAVVYGEPVRVYPGWTSHQPAYATSALVETGAISFGIGVLVGAAVSHHDGWGWNSWGVNWGGSGPDRGYDHGWRRPAVVYNNATYVSKSVTVVNRVSNVDVTNNTVNNRTYNSYHAADNHYQTNNFVNRNQPVATAPVAMPSRAMMSMPHFTSHDAVSGARPPMMPMQAQQYATQPHMNQFAGAAHGAPMATMPLAPQSHPSLVKQQNPPPHQQPGMPHMAQPEQRQARDAERGLQAGLVPRPEIKTPTHEEAKLAVGSEHGQPAMDHAHDAAMRERPPQENHVMSIAPPEQHAQAAMRGRPAPQHDPNLDREQAHAVRQDVLAMHPAHPHPAEVPPANHAENHAEHNHAPEKHDKHAGQEHHA